MQSMDIPNCIPFDTCTMYGVGCFTNLGLVQQRLIYHMVMLLWDADRIGYLGSNFFPVTDRRLVAFVPLKLSLSMLNQAIQSGVE